MDQVKEEVGQTKFLTHLVSLLRVRGQNQVAQELQRLENTNSFKLTTSQLRVRGNRNIKL